MPSVAPAPACTGPAAHRPSKKRKGLSAEEADTYDLFYAIQAGCKACVMHLLYVVGVSAVARSKTQGHTAVDFAEWAEQEAKVVAELSRDITKIVRAAAGLVGPPGLVALRPAMARWVVRMARKGTSRRSGGEA